MTKKEEEILGVWSEFFVGHALSIRAIEERIEGKAPLSLYEYDVLLCISRSTEQRVRFSALADATIYTRSGVTRVMKRLEEEGYVRREECAEDRRGSFAVITNRGKDALRATWRLYSTAVLEILTPCFSLNEAQQLRTLLGRIVEKLSKTELVQIRSNRR